MAESIAYRCLTLTVTFNYTPSGVESFSVTREEAAVMMLMRRGCPQSEASFGIDEQIAALTTQLN